MKKDNAIILGIGAALAGFGIYRFIKRRQTEKKAAAEKELAKATTSPDKITAFPNISRYLSHKLGNCLIIEAR